jgi:membrane-associated phospholipid phosphatase
MGTTAKSAWVRAASRRLRQSWFLKMAGTTLGMTGFFVAYFWLLRHRQFPLTVMPLTAVDRAIGFWPWALPLYLSLWFYVSLPPALLVTRRELLSYAVTAAALSVVGLGIFYFWPTAVPVPAIDWSRYPAFEFLKTADDAGNACPSLHVAFAVFSAVWLDRLARQLGAGRSVRFLNWLWCGGILYSTVAIRQHVALDVVAGAGLGLAAAGAHLRWLDASTRS